MVKFAGFVRVRWFSAKRSDPIDFFVRSKEKGGIHKGREGMARDGNLKKRMSRVERLHGTNRR
jgi:hypothetical protein